MLLIGYGVHDAAKGVRLVLSCKMVVQKLGVVISDLHNDVAELEGILIFSLFEDFDELLEIKFGKRRY